ncbi:His-Xaa-Ser system radical SAM maturase HxsC, partial [Pseudomonas protegens]
MLRKDTHFEIQHLIEPKLLKVVTVDELIEQGVSICAGDVSFDDLILWLPDAELQHNPRLLSLPVGG